VVIVPDSSSWIEYLRRTESSIDRTLDRLIADSADLAVTEVIVMEVLAGARTQRRETELRALMLSYPPLLLQGLSDYERAAALYRHCRRQGETIRKLTDCLIAVPVLRAGAELLSADRDFEAIARHSDLRLYRESPGG
jgi:predicted nucleic acid-binding protein